MRGIVPWRTAADFNEAKVCFYGLKGKLQNPLRGLEITNAWSVRGPLPFAVESTRSLVFALIQDRKAESDAERYVSRLAMSTAIIRFVNTLLDPLQPGMTAMPLNIVAKAIKLPSIFVELRHAATHEYLPERETLRESCLRAKAWLYDHYWKIQGPSTSEDNSMQAKTKRATATATPSIARQQTSITVKDFQTQIENYCFSRRQPREGRLHSDPAKVAFKSKVADISAILYPHRNEDLACCVSLSVGSILFNEFGIAEWLDFFSGFTDGLDLDVGDDGICSAIITALDHDDDVTLDPLTRSLNDHFADLCIRIYVYFAFPSTSEVSIEAHLRRCYESKNKHLHRLAEELRHKCPHLSIFQAIDAEAFTQKGQERSKGLILEWEGDWEAQPLGYVW